MTPIEQAKAALERIKTMRIEDDANTLANEALTALSTIEGSGEPPTYHMSKDYEALYDLLCKGGEALGWVVEDGWRKPRGITSSKHKDGDMHFFISDTGHFTQHERMYFFAECQRLNLEWIAPSPSLSVEGSPEPLAWVPEDELPASLPSEAYSTLFPHSKVDFIRLFPIYGPSLSVDEVIEVVKEELRESEGGIVLGWCIDEDTSSVEALDISIRERLTKAINP